MRASVCVHAGKVLKPTKDHLANSQLESKWLPSTRRIKNTPILQSAGVMHCNLIARLTLDVTLGGTLLVG